MGGGLTPESYVVLKHTLLPFFFFFNSSRLHAIQICYPVFVKHGPINLSEFMVSQ